jgi:hypothetical protein
MVQVRHSWLMSPAKALVDQGVGSALFVEDKAWKLCRVSVDYRVVAMVRRGDLWDPKRAAQALWKIAL